MLGIRSRRRADASDVDVENVAQRLARALAVPGPHDERIGHHRTHEGNVDASLVGRALCRSAARHSAPKASPARTSARVARVLTMAQRDTLPQRIVAQASAGGSKRRRRVASNG